MQIVLVAVLLLFLWGFVTYMRNRDGRGCAADDDRLVTLESSTQSVSEIGQVARNSA